MDDRNNPQAWQAAWERVSPIRHGRGFIRSQNLSVVQQPQSSMLPSGIDHTPTSLSRSNLNDYPAQNSMLPYRLDNGPFINRNRYQNRLLERNPSGGYELVMPPGLDYPPPQVSVMNSSLDRQPQVERKSLLNTDYDRTMAARQTRLNSLSPRERAEQEEWALQYIARMNVCPTGFEWVRYERIGGYICMGGHHATTDALIAKGEGEYIGERNGGWTGPWYWYR
ncbi:hypothetical protein HYALB_00012281 [Hymenoscyphus albidus]|uniref:Uncharacterized protein n=1 Tax=Hymenoscyphus albidus TaxID=595503 RepID=A0A9N9LLW9_9HELO|nr:hypothetical protein HYALB_00012281 [Hymenoscyphus albidus]